MKDKGFQYGRTDDIYIPPAQFKKGWVKPGVSNIEATSIKGECLRQEYSQEHLDQCMEKQGFVYRELTKDELPPCWYDKTPPCKNE